MPERDMWPYERPRVRGPLSFVYFIQSENGGFIKIGTAEYPVTRMKAMQSGCPIILKILGCIKGDYKRERQIHSQFCDERRHFEWFEPTPRLLAFIEDILLTEGIAATVYDRPWAAPIDA